MIHRELKKAFVGFFFLGVILGGFYLALKYVVGVDSARPRPPQFARPLTQVQEGRWPEILVSEAESAPQEPAAASPPVAEELIVQGRVLDETLRPIELPVEVVPAGGAPVALSASEGWLRCPALKNVQQVLLLLPSCGVTSEPVPVSPRTKRLRFNWVIPKAAAASVTLQHAACIEAGKTLYVFVSGEAALPDAARLLISLTCGTRRWCAAEVPVHNKRFRGLLAPAERGYPSGRYTVSVEFNPLLQDPYALTRSETEEPGGEGSQIEHSPQGNPWKAFRPARVSCAVYVGDPSSERREREEELAEYLSLQKKGYLLRRRFLALRDLALSAKGPSWGVRRRAERFFPEGLPQVSRNGALDVPVWRHWVDGVFGPRIEELAQQLARREVPGALQLYFLSESYVNALRKFVKLGSQRVYRAMGLAPDVRDFCSVSLSLEDEESEVYRKLRRIEERLRILFRRQAAVQAGPSRLIK